MTTVKSSLIIAFALLLGACTTTPEECDPNVEQSIWNKIGCSASGSYDKRIQSKEADLQAEQANNAQLQQEYAKASANAKSSQKAVTQARSRLNAMNKSLSSYASQLEQKAKGKKAITDQIKQIENQANNVNASSMSDAEKEAEIKRLRHKLEALQSAVE